MWSCSLLQMPRELLERGPGVVGVGSVPQVVVEGGFDGVADQRGSGAERRVLSVGQADALCLVVAECERHGDRWVFEAWGEGEVAAGGSE